MFIEDRGSNIARPSSMSQTRAVMAIALSLDLAALCRQPMNNIEAPYKSVSSMMALVIARR